MKEKREKPIKHIVEVEFRNLSENDMTLSGYAVTFDQPTIIQKFDGVEFKEVIHRDAFLKTDMKDCCLKYNHNGAFPILARTRGGSLKVNVDEFGLFFEANLIDTQSARDIYSLVKGGVLDKCSFAFTIASGGDEYDPKTRTRTIKNIEKLWDLSVVDIPAYQSTYVTARSFFEAEAEKEMMEIMEREMKQKRLKLKLDIERSIK
jgi:uncharacterized protein